MSKKMMRRSLALGALMTFVITGSAMAAETHKFHEKHDKWEVKETFHVFGEEGLKEDVKLKITDFICYAGEECEHEGYGKFDYYTYAPSAPDTFVFNLNDKTFTVDGDFSIQGDILQVNGISGSSVVASKLTYSAGSSINVDKLEIANSSGNAIYRPEGGSGSANINANSIVINAGNHAFQIHNDLYMGSKDKPVGVLEITAGGKAFNIAQNTAGEGATLEIYAKKLDVIKTTRASKAYAGSTLLVEAQEGDIVTDFETASAGNVDLRFGSGVNWTGKFYTADGATKSALDLRGTWNLKDDVTDLQDKDNSLTNATFRKDSTFVIEGTDYEERKGVYALNGVGENAKLTVEQGAKLKINGITETTYNIAQGFKTVEGTKVDVNTVKYWDVTNVNALMQGVLWDNGENGLQVTVTAKEADKMAADTGMSTSTATLVQSIIENKNNANTPAEKAAVEFIEKAQANNSTPEAVGNAINNATKMGEAGGNSATAASIVKNVTGVTNDRLSFNCGHSAPHKGGHGVGLFEEGSGADIWVEYVHGKDKVEDMPSTAGASSYEGQYNGIVMGVDFKKVNKFQSGIAFNYGEGDTNSVGNAVRTHSDYDFWGVGYYGSIHNDDSNVIFDINYAQTDSDVTQNNSTTVFEASPETTTWSAGVKLEKLYQNENVQIVPYTGLRYMSIDADDYSTKKGEFYYSMDRQDIWLLPLGVSIKQEVTNDNGWTVSPRVDLSYIWAFGDTNSNMEVKSPFPGVSQIGYDVMDDGSFLGLVGIEAHKGQWGYGVAYSYQKGDHSESKKWYVDVNYSF